MIDQTQRKRKFSWPAAVVVLAIILYMVVFSWLTITRAKNFNAGLYDLGIMTQTVWNVGHGHGFVFTNPEAGPDGVHGQNVLRTAIHADYILALLAPLSWFGHTAELLLIIQSAVIAAGAWFVWRIAKKLLGHNLMAMILALVYLAYPPLHFANWFEFHAVTLAITFFLAAADSILAGRHRIFWLWASLALLCKEHVGLTLGLLAGALYWWRAKKANNNPEQKRGEYRRAWMALAVCWLWVALQFMVVIPFSRPAQARHFVYEKFYGQHQGPMGAAKYYVAHPRALWAKTTSPAHQGMVKELLWPLGGVLPLLSPVTYLLFPEPAIYWLGEGRAMQTAQYHYHALWIPFLFLGLIFSLAWLGKVSRRWGLRGRQVPLTMAFGLILVGTAWSEWKMSLWPWSPLSRWPQVAWKEDLQPQVQQAVALVPPGATVAITNNLGAYLAEHPTMQLVPNGIAQVDYIAILERQYDPIIPTNDKRLAEKQMVELLLPWLAATGAYRQLYHQDRVHVWQRTGTPTLAEPVWPAGLEGRS